MTENETMESFSGEGKSGNRASEYLFAAFMEAGWIGDVYKPFAEKYRKDAAALRELYLCACDRVKPAMLESAEKKKPVDEYFRRCRKRHMEELFLAEYSEELAAIRNISDSMAKEVNAVSKKVNHIAEYIPSMEEFFPQEMPRREDAVMAESIVKTEPEQEIERTKMEAVFREPERENSDFRADSMDTEKEKNIHRQENIFKGMCSRMEEKQVNAYISRLSKALAGDEKREDKLKFIIECLGSGDSLKEVRRFAAPELSVENMKRLRNLYRRK